MKGPSTIHWVELGLALVAGLYATLIGFQVVGKKPPEDEKYAVWFKTWGRRLRWLGPLVMACGVLIFLSRFR